GVSGSRLRRAARADCVPDGHAGEASFDSAPLLLNFRVSPRARRTSMPNNSPIHRFPHQNLTVEGYSRAAVQTYWRIPELRIGFDLGAQPWEFMGTGTWFVTHTHLDHIAALPVYVARRRMMRMDPPTIYLPMHAVEFVQK